LRQEVEVEVRFADAPLFDREGGIFGHDRPPSSFLCEIIQARSRFVKLKRCPRRAGTWRESRLSFPRFHRVV
jgi:hypothetical protein